jgi:hypothetical protein
MTSQCSRIFRAFARGESIVQIAESCGVSYSKAWSQLRRAIAEVDRKGGTALDAVRWQQYLMLMRVVDQAFAAFEKSAEEGVSEVTFQTIERADDCGKLGLLDKSVTHHVRKSAGDVRYLEVALKALRELRDLFGIGAEAEGKQRAASPQASVALQAHAHRRGSAYDAMEQSPSRVRINAMLPEEPRSSAAFFRILLEQRHRVVQSDFPGLSDVGVNPEVLVGVPHNRSQYGRILPKSLLLKRGHHAAHRWDRQRDT